MARLQFLIARIENNWVKSFLYKDESAQQCEIWTEVHFLSEQLRGDGVEQVASQPHPHRLRAGLHEARGKLCLDLSFIIWESIFCMQCNIDFCQNGSFILKFAFASIFTFTFISGATSMCLRRMGRSRTMRGSWPPSPASPTASRMEPSKATRTLIFMYASSPALYPCDCEWVTHRVGRVSD